MKSENIETHTFSAIYFCLLPGHSVVVYTLYIHYITNLHVLSKHSFFKVTVILQYVLYKNATIN